MTIKDSGFLIKGKYDDNIPKVFSPFWGTSDMENIHTTFHTPEATTKQKQTPSKKIH